MRTTSTLPLPSHGFDPHHHQPERLLTGPLAFALFLATWTTAAVGYRLMQLHGGLALAVLFGIGALAFALFRRTDRPRLHAGPVGADESTELAMQSHLVGDSYRVEAASTRGFTAMPHYYLQLSDGRTLYLEGRYLRHYDGSGGGPRVFPCTDFYLLLHPTDGHIIGLRCRGEVLQPHHTEATGRFACPPLDGELFPCDTHHLLAAA